MTYTIGEKFNHLTLIGKPSMEKIRKAKRYFALFKCDCGKECVKNYYDVKAGHLKSCGCIKVKHGMTHHPLYAVYRSMVDRCYNPKKQSYKRYGGRGITVCDEWLNDRVLFLKWAIEHGWAKGLQIDRIDGDGNYCPDNCRFVTPLENTSNRSNTRMVVFNGERMAISEAWRRSGSRIRFETVRKRICQNGMSFDRAISKPWKNENGELIV